MNEPIKPQQDKDRIIAELTPDKFVRKTNNANNEVYLFDNNTSPVLMEEVGRLRELTFRHAGGGTGCSLDIDKFDVDPEDPQKQLIVWNPDEQEIIGGYRLYFPKSGTKDVDITKFACSLYFNFSKKFKTKYLPCVMELGRSFVRPEYQSRNKGRKSLYALDNLWDGLGAVILDNKHLNYLFGKITMYPHFNQLARNMILYFLRKHFKDREHLVAPIVPACIDIDAEEMKKIFIKRKYHNDYKILSAEVRKLGETIPPLVNAYMNLSPSMRTFGTFINHHFGNVEETGIMITLEDMYIEKINRHMATYDKDYAITWFTRNGDRQGESRKEKECRMV